MNIYKNGFIYEGYKECKPPSRMDCSFDNKLPVTGSHSFKEGQEVVEGKDYEKNKIPCIGCSGQYSCYNWRIGDCRGTDATFAAFQTKSKEEPPKPQEQASTKEVTAIEDWTTPVNGVINVPDWLDKLVNSIAFQHKLHTISEMFGENEFYCRAAFVAQKFFHDKYKSDNTQIIDTELAGKIWDAAELHKSQLLLSAYPPPSPDKETFINSLNLDNTQIRDSGYSLEDMEKELKEIDKYLDDLCLQTSKDSGNLWIQFSDKFQAFKKKLLTPYPQTKFSRSDCEKKLLLIFRDDVLPHRIKQLVDLCENIYNSKK